MEPIRLNKYLSDHGVCSRRDADKLAESGAITVNGAKAEPGMKVTEKDVILVNGAPVSGEKPKRIVIAVNKPVGVVCTTRAFKGETNIVDMVDFPERLYPVGRLDKDSEGLIFLTNHGEFAAKVTKASGHHEKEYEVTVNKDITEHFIERMQKGVYLVDLDRQTASCKVTKIGEKKFRIVLTQGLNRQIRRMCEMLGYSVVQLKRVRIMNVTLGDMEIGSWREVRGDELETLLGKARVRNKDEKKAADGKATTGTKKTAGAKKTAEGKKSTAKPEAAKNATFGKDSAGAVKKAASAKREDKAKKSAGERKLALPAKKPAGESKYFGNTKTQRGRRG